MKIFLYSVVLVAMAGSAMSENLFGDVVNIAKKDLIQPTVQAVHNATQTVIKVFQKIPHLLKSKRDVSSVSALQNYLGLEGTSKAELKQAIENGAKYLISKRQVPVNAVYGIAEFLRNLDNVKGVSFNVDVHKKHE